MSAPLKIKIFICFSFLCSLSGFGNALALNGMEKTDVDTIEQFTKTVLKQRLVQTTIFNSFERYNVFGYLYATNPENFEFNPGDRKLIMELSGYVRKKSEGGRMQYFARAINGRSKKKTTRTEVGFLYGHPKPGSVFNESNEEEKATESSSTDLQKPNHNLATSLFNKCSKLLTPFGALNVLKFSEDMVTVEKKNGKITGRAVCVLCDTKKEYSVHFEKSYWICTNFKKHLLKKHGDQKSGEISEEKDRKSGVKKPVKKIESKNKPPVTLKPAISLPQQDISSSDNFNVQRNKTDVEIETKVEPNSTANTNKNDSSSPRQIIPQPDNHGVHMKIIDKEEFIFNQLSQQDTKMYSAVLHNREELIAMDVEIDSNRSVRCCTIAGDGNCLFASIAHQLFAEKIDSPEHQNSTSRLRQQAVDFIRNNKSFFAFTLKGRLLDNSDDQNNNAIDIADLNAEAEKFLDERLSKTGTWGGSESLLAISNMYEVNIMIFNENDTYYCFNRFNFNFEKSIFVAFGSFTKIPGTRNHYNSVCQIDNEDLMKCAKKMSMLADAKNLTIISLDDTM